MYRGLIKLFIPSWRFFDSVGSRLELNYLTSTSPNHWLKTLSKSDFDDSLFFFRPRGNFRLAQISILERFATEFEGSQALDQIEASETFFRICNIVREEVRASGSKDVCKQFKFRLVVFSPGTNIKGEPLFESRWIDASV